MIERGMIFNAEMVRAILDGRKTQTRRIVKLQPDEDGLAKVTNGPWVDTSERNYRCPFGDVGDRIWVRETWAEAGASAPNLKLYRANYPEHVPSHYENVPPANEIRWTPSIHMPRWASRILLEITDVRVERLNAINERDAQAEGVGKLRGGFWQHYQPGWTQHQLSARGSFVTLWKSIYGEESWNSNPWVWVVEFKRIEGDVSFEETSHD
ncbi:MULTISPECIES: ASCH domain-containing protein [Klebsiella]|uniref:hypothetical protein n=1 Tax=Klebsiella TaxID=570 RepID=UPI00024FC93B|nr:MULTISPECIES: hypothetical protein [Klebsiella]AKL08552.1 hypothetical protein AB184_26205 [Klebsiella oxytoca]AKL25484.1 hypothetical protein AB181_26485 [Klebsiella oxytoca]EHS95784.1 hypothetical protein HMPREF9687_02108 [Klebsiella oxytoca 10-5243]ELD4398033.1 hypothetical protein [Klebsiella oxytoca]ELG4821906.1 hypothetical protein [Klebsiella oxytoca]